MVKMTKNSVVGGLLEPIKNSAIWKLVLREAVLHEAYVYLEIIFEKFYLEAQGPY